MAYVGIAPVELERPDTEFVTALDVPWITYVFMTHFGYSREHAQKLMTDVHTAGRAVVSNGSREEMERDVAAMHSYGLWATLQKDD